MATMNPYAASGASWCLFESIGISFCPGEGLGHSIALIFRADFSKALEANLLGYLAVPTLLGRIGVLVIKNFMKNDI